MENIIEHLEHQMRTDDECSTKKSGRIKRMYVNASENQKKLMDEIFITICGWSLDTIIQETNNAGEQEEYNKEKLKELVTLFNRRNLLTNDSIIMAGDLEKLTTLVNKL